jgi:hypothetical protein
MKKTSVLLKTVVVMFAVSTIATAQTSDTRWFDKADAKTDMFQISDAKELAGFAQLVNNGNDFRGKTIVLLKDIDLKDWGEWDRIGMASGYDADSGGLKEGGCPFRGIFDGNGKTVKGLYVTRGSESYQGLFGYVVNGVVKNVGVLDLYMNGNRYCGGVVGYLAGGTVENSYSSGELWGYDCGGVVGSVENGSVVNCYSSVRLVVVDWAGGVVGTQRGGRVTNCYSTGDVGHDPFRCPVQNCIKERTPSQIGGVVGLVRGGIVTNCYSTGNVRGQHLVGGVVGQLLTGTVTNCIALNPIVNAQEWGGRVIGFGGDAYQDGRGDYKHTDNFAFRNLRNELGTFPDVRGTSTVNGADITLEKILSDSTLDNNFTKENGWTLAKGKLPGLLGKPVDIPDHLLKSDAIASHDREIPAPVVDAASSGEAVTVTAPLNKLTAEFSAGPNPADKRSGAVNFYFQGKRIKSGSLAIYNAFGNLVGKIGVSDEAPAIGNLSKRLIADWNLKDKSGRSVSKGTYLVRGTVVTEGRAGERVSMAVSVGVR